MNTRSLNTTLDPVKRMLEYTGVRAVFGEPVREGNVTVIPVAEATTIFGGGMGFQPGVPTGSNGAADAEGGGGGYMGRVKPRGYIRISADGEVEYKVLEDPMRQALRGMVVAVGTALILLGIIKAIRG